MRSSASPRPARTPTAEASVAAVRRALLEQLEDLARLGIEELLAAHLERLRSYGQTTEFQMPIADSRIGRSCG
jgi:acetyl-CoA carboxylase alpha subunit